MSLVLAHISLLYFQYFQAPVARQRQVDQEEDAGGEEEP